MERQPIPSPIERMRELLEVIRSSDYTDILALKTYMDMYDAQVREMPEENVKERAIKFLEELDSTEAEFDFIVERYDKAISQSNPSYN